MDHGITVTQWDTMITDSRIRETRGTEVDVDTHFYFTIGTQPRDLRTRALDVNQGIHLIDWQQHFVERCQSVRGVKSMLIGPSK